MTEAMNNTKTKNRTEAMNNTKTKTKTETETKSTTKTTGRHAPAIRLNEVRAMLNSGEGASVYDISDRLGVTVKTARRYITALERAGEPLYEEWDGKRKVWRLMPTARKDNICLSTSLMLSLFLSRRVFDYPEDYLNQPRWGLPTTGGGSLKSTPVGAP